MRRERLWGFEERNSELTLRPQSSQRTLRRITQEHRLKPVLPDEIHETRSAFRGV
jgi:hypothetical protein